MTRAGPLFAAAALALAGPACGKFDLDPVHDGSLDAGWAGAAARADATTARADATADRATGGDAPDAALPATPPFATIVRVINVGAGDLRLYRGTVGACGLGLMIQGGAPVADPTSIEPSDYWCECATCASTTNGFPRCEFSDPICDEPPTVLAPGAHLDYPWDGVALVWLSPTLVATPCTIRCSVFAPIPAGSYAFTLRHATGDHTVQATLPAPGAVVEIPVR